MENLNLKLLIQYMSCRHVIKSVKRLLTKSADGLWTKLNFRKTELNSVIKLSEKTYSMSMKYITVPLILMLSVIGCSDVPYTGPVLTVDHVDRYFNSIGEDTACLQDGFDFICIKYIQGDEYGVEQNVPVVHVYPTSLIFLFHYEDAPILRVERLMYTTQIVQELLDTGEVQLPDNNGNTANNNDIPIEWTIQVYYPDTFPEADRGQTPATSGLNISVADGMLESINKQDELQITKFKQIDGIDGTRGVQFTIETESTEITIIIVGLVSEHIAKFHVNADSVASNEGVNFFQLIPIE